MKKPVVSIVRGTYQSVSETLEKSISLAGGLKISQGKPVIIKINLCGARLPDTGTITHPLFLDALLRYIRKHFGEIEIFVVESDASTAQPDLFIQWFGFQQLIDKWNAKYLNLAKEKTFSKQIDGKHFKRIIIPEIFQDCYFISHPKLKTNLASSLTCVLKNQFGCLPEVRKIKFHKDLDNVIVDCNLAMKPDFCIVDAVTAMGGELGPALGVPIPLNSIICGSDPVAVDSLCARLAGFSPWRVGHIRKASSVKLGSMQYIVVGDGIPQVDFETSKFKMFLFKMVSGIQARKTKS